MTTTKLEQTFLDLIAFDEVHPHEDKILTYIKRRLDAAGIKHVQDKAGNIVATIPGQGVPVALVGHTDIAAPLNGRQVIIEDEVIKTDSTGLLGADDKAAVSAMLELADSAKDAPPKRAVELIFTVGEESGCVGAVALDMSLVQSKEALVLDWLGRVNRIVTKSPAYYKIDVEYIGRDAHPAHWQSGKNAGAALADAVSQLQQGEYSPGVTCNIGILSFGNARNKVPGQASLQGELRSYDMPKIEAAAAVVQKIFEDTAAKHGVTPRIDFVKDSPAFVLNETGDLFAQVKRALKSQGLEPALETTYGCFDGNILAARGIEVIMMGAAMYEPHSPDEYLNRAELAELFEFMKAFVS